MLRLKRAQVYLSYIKYRSSHFMITGQVSKTLNLYVSKYASILIYLLN